jgi:hypothetical protein
VLFVSGALHALGIVSLPQSLHVLAQPIVLGVCGALVVLEFLADKIPGLDTLWDAVHTFIRIPAGALLAVGALGPSGTPAAVAAALLGGTLAGGSHFTKFGGRILINASPEPVSNWTASFGEDAIAPATVFIAFKYPLLLFLALALFVGLSIWLLPKLWRVLAATLTRAGRFLGHRTRS